MVPHRLKAALAALFLITLCGFPKVTLAQAGKVICPGMPALVGDAHSAAGSCTTTVDKTGGVPFAASATTDATNAANITSGTLPAARLPAPAASTLGGVKSFTAPAHEWVSGIGTDGAPTASQPAIDDLANIPNARIVGNYSGAAGPPIPYIPSSILDLAFGGTQGGVLYRGASQWTAAPPGTAGQVWTTGGSGANPSWTTPSAGVQTIPGYMSGCKLSNDASTPNTVIDVAACYAADATNSTMLSLPAATINFAASGGINQLDTGTLAAGYYAIFACGGTSGVGYVATLETVAVTPSPSCPAGYSTYKRYIGSVPSASTTALTKFLQFENRVYLNTFVTDLTVTPADAGWYLATLSVPRGLRVFPIVLENILGSSTTSTNLEGRFRGPDMPTSNYELIRMSTATTSVAVNYAMPPSTTLVTNTSGQIYYEALSGFPTLTVRLITLGWIDPYIPAQNGAFP